MMRREYDFSRAVRNPYARRLKRQVTMRIDNDTLDYFRRLAGEIGIHQLDAASWFLRARPVSVTGFVDTQTGLLPRDRLEARLAETRDTVTVNSWPLA